MKQNIMKNMLDAVKDYIIDLINPNLLDMESK